MIDNPIKVRLSIIYNTWRGGREGRGKYNSRTRLATYETRRQRVKTLIAFFTDVERSKDAFFPPFLLPLSSFFPFFFSSRGGCVAERKQEDNAVTGSSPRLSLVFKEILDYFSDIGSTQFPISSIHSHVPVACSNPQWDGTSVHSQF